MTPVERWLAADIIRLYRRLKAAGIAFPDADAHLHLAADGAALRLLALNLIRRAVPQTVPDAILLDAGHTHLAYCLPAPLLWRSLSRSGDQYREILQCFTAYAVYPVYLTVSQMLNGEGILLMINLNDVDSEWFQFHSLREFLAGSSTRWMRSSDWRLNSRARPQRRAPETAAASITTSHTSAHR